MSNVQTIIIGLGYRARQGKRIVAEEMQVMLPELRIYSFANELKWYCREHHEELYKKYPHVDKSQKEDPIYGYVSMLQHFGTDIMRTRDPNHWIKALEKRILAEAPSVVLIDDVRFPNEAEWIKEQNGFLIEVYRYGEDGKQYLDPKRDPNHESETALDGYDGWNYVITASDGELDKLRLKARSIISTIVTEEFKKRLEEGKDEDIRKT